MVLLESGAKKRSIASDVGISPVLVFLFAFLVCSPGAFAEPLARFQMDNGIFVAEFKLPGKSTYKLSRLSRPDRLVIDFTGIAPEQLRSATTQIPSNQSLVKGARIGNPRKGVARLVFDLAEEPAPPRPRIQAHGKKGKTLIVALKAKNSPPGNLNADIPPETHVAQAAPAPAKTAPAEPPRFDISRFEVSGNSLIDTQQILALTASHTGTARDFGDVQRALEAVQQAYLAAGYGSVQVFLPEQELTQGVVKLQVIEPKIRAIRVEGNHFFGTDNIRESVPALREGTTPSTPAIAAALKLANENPAKQSSVQLRNTDNPEQMDAVIKVVDEKPWKVALSLDNTGTPATGISRLGIAYQHANIADRDQVLTLQYITSPSKPKQVGIYGAGYHVPLYGLGDSVDIFAGYADVDSGKVENLFNISGRGTVAGLRYNQLFRPIGAYEHRVIYGIDYRDYETHAVLIGSTTSLVPDVRVHPLSVAYAGQWTTPSQQAGFNITAVRNFPGGKDGQDSTFQAARAEATSRYSALRFNGQFSQALPSDWQFRVAGAAQYSRHALISGEQFGIAGANAVRGFREREVADDRGYHGSIELYSPDFGGLTRIGGTSARGLVFYDFGRVLRNRALAGEQEAESISSIGLGLRMNIRKDFFLRLDWANVRDGGGGQDRSENKLHLNTAYTF